jgi:hypothetical protein
MFIKSLIITAFLAITGFCLNAHTVPNNPSDSSLIRASDFRQNNDSLEAWTTRIIDSIDGRFIRFSDLNSGDSTLKRVQVDTIRSNPDIDSIRGRPFIDSADIRFIDVTKGNIDSIMTRPFIDSIDTRYISASSFNQDTLKCLHIRDSSGSSPGALQIFGYGGNGSAFQNTAVVQLGISMGSTMNAGIELKTKDGYQSSIYMGDSTAYNEMEIRADQSTGLLSFYNNSTTAALNIDSNHAVTINAAGAALASLTVDGPIAATNDRVTARSLSVDSIVSSLTAGVMGPFIDTIKTRYINVSGRIDVDTIDSYPYIDSLKVGILRGIQDVDSIKGNPFIDTVTTHQMLVTDSAYIDTLTTGIIKATYGNIVTGLEVSHTSDVTATIELGEHWMFRISNDSLVFLYDSAGTYIKAGGYKGHAP